MSDYRRIRPQTREQWAQSLDMRNPAHERVLLWRLAADGMISRDELYQRLAELHRQHGDECYKR